MQIGATGTWVMMDSGFQTEQTESQVRAVWPISVLGWLSYSGISGNFELPEPCTLEMKIRKVFFSPLDPHYNFCSQNVLTKVLQLRIE